MMMMHWRCYMAMMQCIFLTPITALLAAAVVLTMMFNHFPYDWSFIILYHHDSRNGRGLYVNRYHCLSSCCSCTHYNEAEHCEYRLFHNRIFLRVCNLFKDYLSSFSECKIIAKNSNTKLFFPKPMVEKP